MTRFLGRYLLFSICDIFLSTGEEKLAVDWICPSRFGIYILFQLWFSGRVNAFIMGGDDVTNKAEFYEEGGEIYAAS